MFSQGVIVPHLTKLLITAGSAAGIAATFNAPIAGVMFSTEIVLLGDYEIASFAAIVIASGIATVVSRGYYGTNPAFIVPQYETGEYLRASPLPCARPGHRFYIRFLRPHILSLER